MLLDRLPDLLVLVGCVALAHLFPMVYIGGGVIVCITTFVMLGKAFEWQGMWKDIPAAIALGFLWPGLLAAGAIHVARIHISARIDA